MERLIQDLRGAVRALAAHPGFALGALLSLAIGVGANTAIFSVVRALLLKPLSYPEASRLAILWNRSPGLGIDEDWFSTAQYADIRNGVAAFETVALAIGANYNLSGTGDPERVGTIRTTSALLPMLGARPILGRLFVAEEDAPGQAGTAVLSHGLWVRRFGGAAEVIGRSIILNGQSYQVVGVLDPAFRLPRAVMPTLGGAEEAEVLLPLPLAEGAAQVRNREDYNLLARLAPGATFEQAQRELEALTARLRAAHPDVYPPHGQLTFSAVPLQDQVVGRVRPALTVLMGAVGLVLAIACANVANLLLSRALGRRREVAIRSALGATRRRIVQQVLTESLALAAIGGAAGLVAAYWSLGWIRALGGRSVPRLEEIAIDPLVLAFTLGATVLAGLLFGLAPAWRLAQVDLQSDLKTATRGSSGEGGWNRSGGLRRLLVTTEVALAVVLLLGAGLLIRSFVALQRVEPGFTPDSVLTLELTLTGSRYGDADAVLGAYRTLAERLVGLPGVEAAGGVSAIPLSGMMAWGPISLEGRRVDDQDFINVDQRVLLAGYLDAMAIPVVAGRGFEPGDRRDQPRVALIDRRMAERLWPDGSAVGRRFRTGGMDARPDAPWITIVGVVGSIKQDRLDADSRMAVYLPHAQVPARAMTLTLRSALDPADLTTAVRRTIADLDPDLPIYRVQTMAQRVDGSLAERRFSVQLLAIFAALALCLAMLGVYSVLTYLVAQGSREIGIRIALGASRRRILGLVVGQGMRPVGVGLILGLAVALLVARAMRGLLFGVDGTDPVTLAATVAVLAAVAAAACAIPAWRAAATDPLVSIRAD